MKYSVGPGLSAGGMLCIWSEYTKDDLGNNWHVPTMNADVNSSFDLSAYSGVILSENTFILNVHHHNHNQHHNCHHQSGRRCHHHHHCQNENGSFHERYQIHHSQFWVIHIWNIVLFQLTIYLVVT